MVTFGGGLGEPGTLIFPPFFSHRQLWGPKWLPGLPREPPGPIRASIFTIFDAFCVHVPYDIFVLFLFVFCFFYVVGAFFGSPKSTLTWGNWNHCFIISLIQYYFSFSRVKRCLEQSTPSTQSLAHPTKRRGVPKTARIREFIYIYIYIYISHQVISDLSKTSDTNREYGSRHCKEIGLLLTTTSMLICIHNIYPGPLLNNIARALPKNIAGTLPKNFAGTLPNSYFNDM